MKIWTQEHKDRLFEYSEKQLLVSIHIMLEQLLEKESKK